MANPEQRRRSPTLGLAMVRFGRRLMRTYAPPIPESAEQTIPPAWEAYVAEPLNWEQFDEAAPPDGSPDYDPLPAPRPQRQPRQRPAQRPPVQRKDERSSPPAQRKQSRLDPRLQRIWEFHQQRELQRREAQVDQVRRQEDEQEQGQPNEQAQSNEEAPRVPGRRPRSRASFSYIETAPLKVDKDDKPKQSKSTQAAADSWLQRMDDESDAPTRPMQAWTEDDVDAPAAPPPADEADPGEAPARPPEPPIQRMMDEQYYRYDAPPDAPPPEPSSEPRRSRRRTPQRPPENSDARSVQRSADDAPPRTENRRPRRRRRADVTEEPPAPRQEAAGWDDEPQQEMDAAPFAADEPQRPLQRSDVPGSDWHEDDFEFADDHFVPPGAAAPDAAPLDGPRQSETPQPPPIQRSAEDRRAEPRRSERPASRSGRETPKRQRRERREDRPPQQKMQRDSDSGEVRPAFQGTPPAERDMARREDPPADDFAAPADDPRAPQDNIQREVDWAQEEPGEYFAPGDVQREWSPSEDFVPDEPPRGDVQREWSPSEDFAPDEPPRGDVQREWSPSEDFAPDEPPREDVQREWSPSEETRREPPRGAVQREWSPSEDFAPDEPPRGAVQREWSPSEETRREPPRGDVQREWSPSEETRREPPRGEVQREWSPEDDFAPDEPAQDAAWQAADPDQPASRQDRPPQRTPRRRVQRRAAADRHPDAADSESDLEGATDANGEPLNVHQALVASGMVAPDRAWRDDWADEDEYPPDAPPVQRFAEDEDDEPSVPQQPMDVYEALQAAGMVPPDAGRAASDSVQRSVDDDPLAGIPPQAREAVLRQMRAHNEQVRQQSERPASRPASSEPSRQVQREWDDEDDELDIDRSLPSEEQIARAIAPDSGEAAATGGIAGEDDDEDEAQAGEGVDINQLARDVYKSLRNRLRIERERRRKR